MTQRDELTLVVFGDDWGRHVSSMQHVFSRLLDRVTVLWINGIGHREPGLQDVGRAMSKVRAMARRTRIVPGASSGARPHVVLAPKVLPWHLSPPVARFNQWSLTRDIRRAIGRHSRGDVVLVTGSPPSANVVGQLGEIASVYFCMDDFLELPGTSPRMMDLCERALLRKVDAVVATAARLVERKRSASGRGYYLPQGVNYEHFAAPRPVPPDMAALPRPIIGFAGGVGAAIDAPTIQALARANASGSLVLVGPVHGDTSTLYAPNVYLLGARSYAELPAYVQAFDVGIIPYVENDWTRAVDPLKLLEYLAAGIPVVTSPLPEVEKYRNVVRIASLGDPFAVAAMEAAMGEAPVARERARSVARANTWDSRAARFLEIVGEIVAAKAASSGVAAAHPVGGAA